MQVYFLGNVDYKPDSWAIEVSERLKKDFPQLRMRYLKPNEDLPVGALEDMVIIDTVSGIDEVYLFKEEDLNKISLAPRTSAHEFDLAFQLKYLNKLGKLKKVRILGIPITGSYDYNSVHSIFKKLVAQDMQGS
jgi:Ni,Fe-hydrogenase maturation factor